MLNRLKKALLVLTGLSVPIATSESIEASQTKESPETSSSNEVAEANKPHLATKMGNAIEVSKSEALTSVGRRLQDIEGDLYRIKEGIKSGTIKDLDAVIYLSPKDDKKREEFPGQRRGGGTHLLEPIEESLKVDKGDRGEFPERRVGGGTRVTPDEIISDELEGKNDRDSFPGRRQGGGGG